MPMQRMHTSQNWQANHFEAAIIDLDGTLVDTLGDFVAVLQKMLQDLPLPYSNYVVTRSAVALLVGKGTEHLITRILKLSNENAAEPLPPSVYPFAYQQYLLHYHRLNGQYARVFDGVFAGLEQFKSWGWRMACVTNKPTDLAKALLKMKNLEGYFELVLGGDACDRKKPDPQPLLRAVEHLGVSVAKTLMVGDSSNDAIAARAAGCPVLLVNYGYNHGLPVQDVDADAKTDSLESVFGVS